MISVLMSVYNEKDSEIRESIDSILGQSYSDFELIIVVDRPENQEAIDLLNEYAEKDERVKIIINEKNMGLALSMNVAAEAASGEYFLRMDADDICYPERFKLQYEAIKNSDYDLICGNYDFIDEDGNLLPNKVPVYSDNQIAALFPHRNIIHHPTIIMRADKFRAIGGYRNYKCAQDYDLWLRMLCAGYKMHMMPEKLIKYRVRMASVTVSQRYRQAATVDYIRSLYEKKNNLADYSYEGYLEYLEKRDANKKEANLDFIANSELYEESKRMLKRGKVTSGITGLIKVFTKSKYYRPNILRSLKILCIKKILK